LYRIYFTVVEKIHYILVLNLRLQFLNRTNAIYIDKIAKQKVYEFCLFAAPLKIKGGTASPIRLLALV